MSLCLLIHADSTVLWLEIVWSVFTGSIYIYVCACVYACMYICMYAVCVYIYGYSVFHRPHPMCSSTLYAHVWEMLCTSQRCCARFPALVHVSQKLCTSHKPPNNVRVPLYTHWAHYHQQKHWGDQTRSPDIYIYKHIKTYKNTDKWWYMHVTYITVYSFIFNHILPKSAFRFVSRGSCGEMHQKCQKIKESWKCPK